MEWARVLLAVTVFMLIHGCATLFYEEGEEALAAGIQAYENGNYGDASRYLQSGLDLGLGVSGRVKAHKYLAFIHCAADRRTQCLAEFRNALAADPSFELSPAEAGHPVWGPIFHRARTGR